MGVTDQQAFGEIAHDWAFHMASLLKLAELLTFGAVFLVLCNPDHMLELLFVSKCDREAASARHFVTICLVFVLVPTECDCCGGKQRVVDVPLTRGVFLCLELLLHNAVRSLFAEGPRKVAVVFGSFSGLL